MLKWGEHTVSFETGQREYSKKNGPPTPTHPPKGGIASNKEKLKFLKTPYRGGPYLSSFKYWQKLPPSTVSLFRVNEGF